MSLVNLSSVFERDLVTHCPFLTWKLQYSHISLFIKWHYTCAAVSGRFMQHLEQASLVQMWVMFFYVLDIVHCHLVSWTLEMCWHGKSQFPTHRQWHTCTLSHFGIGLSSNINTQSWRCCGTACMSCCQSRAEENRVRSRRWEGANFGCMACGVKITIFSAALFHHPVCSITIYCREREGHKERGRKRRARAMDLRGGGAQWCRGWGSRCERVGETTVSMTKKKGREKSIVYKGVGGWEHRLGVRCGAELTSRVNTLSHEGDRYRITSLKYSSTHVSFA